MPSWWVLELFYFVAKCLSFRTNHPSLAVGSDAVAHVPSDWLFRFARPDPDPRDDSLILLLMLMLLPLLSLKLQTTGRVRKKNRRWWRHISRNLMIRRCVSKIAALCAHSHCYFTKVKIAINSCGSRISLYFRTDYILLRKSRLEGREARFNFTQHRAQRGSTSPSKDRLQLNIHDVSEGRTICFSPFPSHFFLFEISLSVVHRRQKQQHNNNNNSSSNPLQEGQSIRPTTWVRL